MSVRQPVRLLDISRLTEAYPLELVADFSTGNLTFVKQDGSTVEHKKPGTLTLKHGTTVLANAVNLYDDIDITIPDQTSISGNAATATKLETARRIGITGGATGTAQSFDGTANINIPITALDATLLNGVAPLTSIPNIPWANVDNKPTFSTVATSGSYNDLSNTPTIYTPSDEDPLVASVADAGTSNDLARADHVHPAQTTITGNAGTATRLATARNFTIGSTSKSFNGSANVAWTLTEIGAAATNHTHDDLYLGINANAISATTLETARTLTIGSTGKTFDGSGNVSWTLAEIGAAATNHNHDTTYLGINATAAAATKLATARTLTIGTATAKSFDGTANLSWSLTDIGAAATNHTHDYLPLSGGTITGVIAPSATNIIDLGTSAVKFRTIYAYTFHGQANSAAKLAVARTINLSGLTSTGASFDGTANATINVTAVPASLLTGTIDIARIPRAALERMIPVQDDAARLALTIDDAQNGDVVKVESTGLMYYIVDEDQLGTEAAFSAFTAGTAASVDWTGINNKPTFATVATSGSYNDLTNRPTIYQPSTTTPLVAGTAAVGTGTTFARADHVHPVQTSVSGNAGTATTLATARTLTIGSTGKTFNGSANVAWTLTEIGAAATNHTHSNYLGISDNAVSATKLATPIGITIGSTSKDFDGSEEVAWTLAEIGAAATNHTHSNYLTTTGTAAAATKLATARTLTIGSTGKTFDGSANVSWSLSEIGAAATSHTHSYIPLSGGTITGAITPSTTNTIDLGTSSIKYRTIYATTFNGNATTATTLATARNFTIGSTAKSFNGSAAVSWTLAEIGAAATSHNHDDTYLGISATAAAATKLATARTFTIGTATAKSFDGSANLSWSLADIGAASASHTHSYLPLSGGTITGAINPSATNTISLGTSSLKYATIYATTFNGNATTATTLATARTLTIGSTGKTFNGSANVSWTLAEIGAAASSHTHSYLPLAGGTITGAIVPSATGTIALGSSSAAFSTVYGNTFSGNAATATSLATARTLTIGSTGKTFNGSSNVSWTLAEIGAAATSHTHSGYLATTGGTMTGTLTISTAGNVAGISVKYTATVGTTWSGSAAPYTQTITVTGITATDTPIIDYVNSGTYATDQAREEAFSNIYRIVTAANSITVYAHEATTTSCPIQLLVIR